MRSLNKCWAPCAVSKMLHFFHFCSLGKCVLVCFCEEAHLLKQDWEFSCECESSSYAIVMHEQQTWSSTGINKSLKQILFKEDKGHHYFLDCGFWVLRSSSHHLLKQSLCEAHNSRESLVREKNKAEILTYCTHWWICSLERRKVYSDKSPCCNKSLMLQNYLKVFSCYQSKNKKVTA